MFSEDGTGAGRGEVVRVPFACRLWLHETADRMRWRIAYLLPRSIALLAFVRVASASGDGPSDVTYVSAYRAWEKGAGT